MCHITKDEWKDYYENLFNEIDIIKLKEEIRKYNLEDVITLNNYEYKVIGWGDLETRFNDDRNIARNKNKDKER